MSDSPPPSYQRPLDRLRVLAKQDPTNVMASWQGIVGSSLVNEFRIGYNAPRTSATASGPGGGRREILDELRRARDRAGLDDAGDRDMADRIVDRWRAHPKG